MGLLVGLREGLCNQVYDAHIASRNMGSDTVQLALRLRQQENEGFGDFYEVGHDVHSSNTVTK